MKRVSGNKRTRPSKASRKCQRPRPKPAPPMSAFSLVERKLEGRKFVEFPHMKGKILDKVELFTTPEYHSISMDFQDRTSLALRIEPCLRSMPPFSMSRAATRRFWNNGCRSAARRERASK
jgi:hypothetical protein